MMERNRYRTEEDRFFHSDGSSERSETLVSPRMKRIESSRNARRSLLWRFLTDKTGSAKNDGWSRPLRLARRVDDVVGVEFYRSYLDVLFSEDKGLDCDERPTVNVDFPVVPLLNDWLSCLPEILFVNAVAVCGDGVDGRDWRRSSVSGILTTKKVE